MLFILPLLIIQLASSLSISQEPIYLQPEITRTIDSQIQYFQEFCFYQRDLSPNQRYDIKGSFQGSAGININILWRTDNHTTLEQLLTTFKPMDTLKLRFKTTNDGTIEDFETNVAYCFYMIGYRNTRARDNLAKEAGFKYQIKIEEVVIDDLPLYAIIQYLGALALSIIMTKLFLYQVQKVQALNSIFEVSMKKDRLA